MKIKDMTGMRFGKLIVLNISHSDNGIYWKCECDCGEFFIVKGHSLRIGSTKSCGCGSLEAAMNNLEKSWVNNKLPFPYTRKLKDAYKNMISRCYDYRNKRYDCYGGRGIRVCKKWLNNHILFYQWMTDNGYKPGLSIDRKNNDGNYSPSNCRIVNNYVQANNTRHNRLLTWKNKTKTVSQWARDIGVNPRALQHRVDRNWTLDRIFNQPFRNRLCS